MINKNGGFRYGGRICGVVGDIRVCEILKKISYDGERVHHFESISG